MRMNQASTGEEWKNGVRHWGAAVGGNSKIKAQTGWEKKKKGTSEDTRLHTGQTDREKNDSERIKKKILKGEMSFLLLLFFSAMSSMTELNNLRHF